jgi:hypothetical protein
MVDLQIALISSTGQRINLGTTHQTDFMLGTDVSGFGLPQVSVDIAEGAGDGGTWQRTRRLPRVVDLPILVFGTSRADLQTKLRLLGQVVSDREGPVVLQADYGDGTSVYLKGHLIDGGQTEYGKNANLDFCRWVLSLKCPDPYWTQTEPLSFTIKQNLDTDGLLPYLAELRLTDSQGFGDVMVNNPGEVEAWPIWVITGPCDGFTIENDQNIGFSYDATITSGNQVKIDTKAGTVESASGTNLYSNLSTAPKLFAFPTGTSSVSVVINNAANDTLVQCYFNPRHEVIY